MSNYRRANIPGRSTSLRWSRIAANPGSTGMNESKYFARRCARPWFTGHFESMPWSCYRITCIVCGNYPKEIMISRDVGGRSKRPYRGISTPERITATSVRSGNGGFGSTSSATRTTCAIIGITFITIPSSMGWRNGPAIGHGHHSVKPSPVDGVTARVISGVASHIQVEETEALHVSRIALMVRGYLRSECVKELLSQAQDSSLTHSTLQLRATMSAIRHPCLIMGQCPSNFEGRNRMVHPRLGRK